MSFMIFYSDVDAALIGDSYQAARLNLTNNDRDNIDRVWTSGLNTFATAPVAFNATTQQWSTACNNPTTGQLDRGLCDTTTRLVTINGTWRRTVAPYSTQNQPITKSGFVTLWHKVADADPDLQRRQYMHTIADDIAATAKEPAPIP